MRKYKFRAWDDKSKEWLLGYELPNLGGFSLFGECAEVIGHEDYRVDVEEDVNTERDILVDSVIKGWSNTRFERGV